MIFDLDNITVRELYQLEDEQQFLGYMKLQEILKPNPVFVKRKAVAIGTLSFDQVSMMKKYLAKPTFDNLFECFSMIFGVKKYTYLSQDVAHYLSALNWIKAEVLKIVEREKKNLSSEPDPILEAAGLERLVPFGELNVLKSIGERFGISPMEVGKWQYNVVFALMMHDKVSSEVQSRYNELKYGSKGQT